MTRTLIKNGTVVSPTGVARADVLIDGETIAAVGAPGFFADAAPTRRHGDRRHRQVRDPGRHRRAHPHGAAVRRHVRLRHVRDRHRAPRRGAASRRSSTSPCSAPARTCRTGLADWHRKADGNCAIDYGFHQIIGGVDDESLKAMDTSPSTRASRASSCSWPTPASSTATTARSCGRCRRPRECGAMIMMHAENGIAIDVLVAQALARGETDPGLPRAHPAVRSSRPRPRTGRSCSPRSPATCRSTSCTCRPGDALEEVAAARDAGRNVFAETCPQYL